ncbi:MAG: inositol monophosphatase family protein [Pseudomonadota bacterium]
MPADDTTHNADPFADDPLLALLARLGDAARAETMPRFRRTGVGENKAEGSARGFDPVTEADRASEAAIRAILAEAAPADSILGEEEAAKEGTSSTTWVIDPIDGTRAFVSGIPLWGTLIARDDGTRGSHALVDHPAVGERFIGATGRGAWLLSGSGAAERIAVSGTRKLSEATLITTAPEMFGGGGAEAFAAARDRARLTRYGTDCYGYALVAMGTADIVIETGLAAYDIAAPKALVEAAGGVVTDWEGGDCRWGGSTIAAATPELHAEALALFRGL